MLIFQKRSGTIALKKIFHLVYASSAATYGDGELGYKDDHDLPYKLNPLNPYGKSKNEFDKWVLKKSRVRVRSQKPHLLLGWFKILQCVWTK